MSRRRYGFHETWFWLFLALLAWLPLPVGSNRPVWIAIALIWMMVILSGCLLSWMFGRSRLPDSISHARPALWIWAGLLLWGLAQAIITFDAGSAWVPAFIADAYQQAAATTWFWNIDAAAAWGSFWHLVLLAGVFACTLLLVDSRRRIRQLMWLLVWVGLLLSVITGVFVMERLDRAVFGLNLTSYGWATGSFVNRNHFANYLVLVLCTGIGLLMTMQNNHHADSWRQRIRNGILTLLGPKARLRVFLALIVITLVLTRSRMGNMSFFVGLLIAGGLALLLIRGRQRSLAWLIGSLLAIDILIIGSWFGMDQVVERIQQTVSVEQSVDHQNTLKVHAQDRLGAFRETRRVVAQVPLTGTGGGSYYTLFPHLRQPDQKFLDHAHNDYVELAVEFGLPAFLLMLSLLMLTATRSVASLARRRDPLALGVAFTGLMALLTMALHAAVDFSLHITANSATFIVIVALQWTLKGQQARAADQSA